MPISDIAGEAPGETAPPVNDGQSAVEPPLAQPQSFGKAIVFTVPYGGFLDEGGTGSAQAFQAIADLRRLGIRCFLITGLSKGDLLHPPEIATAFDGYCLEGGAQWGSWENPRGPANATVVMAAADRAEQAGIKVQRRRASFTCSLEALEAVRAMAGDCVVSARRDLVNVLPPGLDKGIGLEAVLGQLGIRSAHAVCLAATEDDVPLLESADVALAPADAGEAAKLAADEVLATTGHAAVLEACGRLARGEWRPNAPTPLPQVDSHAARP